ncbi:uncharacterized protein LOC118455461 [Neolamprologus brichardi]|uniref:uncharacterized protein LOC118455461 n=1 Tax=Neolamprologus brichardi TaxID=32507 RepID=UPI0016438928|nr:uncharacterized protein LOC118455461 [Neolamprologus brichardi]
MKKKPLHWPTSPVNGSGEGSAEKRKLRVWFSCSPHSCVCFLQEEHTLYSLSGGAVTPESHLDESSPADTTEDNLPSMRPWGRSQSLPAYADLIMGGSGSPFCNNLVGTREEDDSGTSSPKMDRSDIEDGLEEGDLNAEGENERDQEEFTMNPNQLDFYQANPFARCQCDHDLFNEDLFLKTDSSDGFGSDPFKGSDPFAADILFPLTNTGESTGNAGDEADTSLSCVENKASTGTQCFESEFPDEDSDIEISYSREDLDTSECLGLTQAVGEPVLLEPGWTGNREETLPCDVTCREQTEQVRNIEEEIQLPAVPQNSLESQNIFTQPDSHQNSLELNYEPTSQSSFDPYGFKLSPEHSSHTLLDPDEDELSPEPPDDDLTFDPEPCSSQHQLNFDAYGFDITSSQMIRDFDPYGFKLSPEEENQEVLDPCGHDNSSVNDSSDSDVASENMLGLQLSNPSVCTSNTTNTSTLNTAISSMSASQDLNSSAALIHHNLLEGDLGSVFGAGGYIGCPDVADDLEPLQRRQTNPVPEPVRPVRPPRPSLRAKDKAQSQTQVIDLK